MLCVEFRGRSGPRRASDPDPRPENWTPNKHVFCPLGVGVGVFYGPKNRKNRIGPAKRTGPEHRTQSKKTPARVVAILGLASPFVASLSPHKESTSR